MAKCLLCGREVKHLPPHLHHWHPGITFREYCRMFNIPEEARYELMTGSARKPWNRGMTREEFIRRMGLEGYLGWQRKRSEALKRYYATHPEALEKLRMVGVKTIEKLKRTRTSQVEKVLYEVLRRYGEARGFQALHQEPYHHFTVPDITIAVHQRKLLIYVDGCFFHCCPHCGIQPKHPVQIRNLEHDRELEEKLRNMGANYVRVWEHEVVNNLSEVVYCVLKFIELLREKDIKIQGRLLDLKKSLGLEYSSLRRWL